MTELTRIDLATGVSLDVQLLGDPAHPPVILLHGFPESHRTWRTVAPDLARDHFVIAPDQRGYARSSKPEGVASYAPEKIVGDMIALADHLGLARFALVGHDWGGAIAWMAALRHSDRVARLVICNAPHPLVFQRALFADPEQRRHSQYITRFRDPDIDATLASDGYEEFFRWAFGQYDPSQVTAEDKAAYLDEWRQPGAMTAMLNWYRASPIVVPPQDATPAPPAWLDAPFPPIAMPTLVVWGLQDKALLPGQLEGLDALVPDLTVVRVPGAGHFLPWEDGAAVVKAMREWL